ncbi:cold-inducible protein YdjO-related protein [Effusibacillus consociatus]|uniref:Cold-inducible protein YdjO-related protein n=1 Tax=Effusibacillus consociatus TaxID=1117041 RepID=A0ABV9Q7W7_9BACL
MARFSYQREEIPMQVTAVFQCTECPTWQRVDMKDENEKDCPICGAKMRMENKELPVLRNHI